MKLVVASIVIAASTAQSYAAPQCEDRKAIWANDGDGSRYIVYGPFGIVNGDVFFENWRGNRLAFRVKGSVNCSNGVSLCVLSLADNSEAAAGNGEMKETEVAVETIDDNGDGLSEYAVFASLSQTLYYAEGLKNVEWFNGFVPNLSEPVVLPNVYKFFGCRKTDEINLDAPKTSPQ